MARHGFQGPRFEVPEERAAAVRGLTERQARLASEAIDRQRIFVPLFRPEFVADQLKEEAQGA